ncbi:MAG: hypothetical protein JWP84_4740 [Tardiphaga sp.]|jgi:hypothetical protein|nr:hypothetical protein [Tardiphaga sp.]MDB5632347.1 hypothetical protein [Tardiphaga sp.]
MPEIIFIMDIETKLTNDTHNCWMVGKKFLAPSFF